MEKLKDILWPIILVGGFGAFIDFLIGKAGQVKAKDFLLKWWVRFDDVRWRNFGREEGIFAGHLIEIVRTPNLESSSYWDGFFNIFLVVDNRLFKICNISNSRRYFLSRV